MTSRREFDNPYPDYDEKIHSSDGKPDLELCSKIEEWISQRVGIMRDNLHDDRDYSIYTGTTGIALLFFRLAETAFKDLEKGKDLLNVAEQVLKSSNRRLGEKRITFLCGDAGPLSLGAVLASRKGDLVKSERYIKALIAMVDRCCNDKSIPDEVLYGKAGYLYALLFVQKYIGEGTVNERTILKVCDAILKSGAKLAREDHSRIPLKYTWHGKEYIGAAHGYIGILYMLLQPQLQKHDLIQQASATIKESIDQLMSIRYPSGNFPSSVGSQSDKLIHWCHGAPGAVHLLSRAFQVYGDEKYLTAAKKCCDVIWKRGFLQKGYGLCHGIAGNGYAFLALYNLTKDCKYLYYANKFGEWCLDYGKHGCRTPDSPFSLFEGLAGTTHFMADLLEPENAHFPAFQL